MKKSRWLSALLALILVFSLCTSAFAADPEQPADSGKRLQDSLPYPHANAVQAWNDGQHKAGDQVRAIVLMSGQPTSEIRDQSQRLKNVEAKLQLEHHKIKQLMKQQQVAFKVNFEYTALLNGMSVTMDYADLETVAAIPGVTEVYLAREYRLPETQPNATSASDMIEATLLDHVVGADGSGRTVAVLDTGITAAHEAFQVYDGMLQTPAYNEAKMRSKIVDLGRGDYYNQKVPYQYDYADGDNDALDDGSSHGSHVAGISAGYVATSEGEVTFRGSAPDAQILAMKIFSSTSKTTSSDIYFAALEDAFKLDADVINMSIGSPNGFTHDSELESATFGNIYRRLEDAGIICCISAGNESTMAEYARNFTGGGYVTADYTDYGVLGSPASYDGNIAVAAMENVIYPAYQLTVGEESFSYRDSNGTAFLDKFSGQDLEYVMVPDLGVEEAYAELDVAGKIAVISRGDITFEEKVSFAAAAGAEGVVIYDNRAGELVSMAIESKTIPSIFVSQEAGAAFEALAEKTFHVDSEPTVIENPSGWGMASFSSWGPTNDLKIKPTITGIGGNVNSVLAGTTNGYEVASGTSMSAPNVSGGYASLLEAIRADNPDLSKAEAAAIARNRTLSHAHVAIDYMSQAEDGSDIYVPYSPRRQGAGLMDLVSAYTATVDISDPLVELGDDPAKSGVYTIKAELKNTADTEQTFDVSVDVLTDGITGGYIGGQLHLYNAMQSVLLEEGVDYTLDAPKSVTLAAGEKQTVTVTITLTDDMKAGYLDTYFANGAFIEGYVNFDSFDAKTYTKEWSHATFMGYYGDWTSAPILETHDWRELMDVEVDPEYSENPMDYVDWEINTTPTMAYLVDEEYNPRIYAGDAPFGYPEGGVYSDKRIAVSYNTDAAYFTKLLVVPTIIRNARHIIMIARNAETGEIYAVDDTPYCGKTIFDVEEGGFSTYAWFLFDGTNIYSADGAPIADDTNVVLEFYCNYPYGEDELGSMTPEEIVANGAQYLQYTVPVVVDGAAPVIEDYEYDSETGELTVTVTDNQYLAAIYVMDEEGNDLVEPELFADDEAGQTNTVTLNIGEQASFYIGALDYATNESYEYVYVEHDHVLTAVEAVEPTCEDEGFAESWVCDKCGATFADAEGEVEITAENVKDYVVPALGHDLQKVEAVAVTCESDGNVEYWRCSRCGKLYAADHGMQEISEEDVIVKASGHDLTAVAEVPATCEADGVKAYWKCENCGKLFSDAEGTTEIAEPEAIEKLGHDWDEGKVTKEPTIAEEGEKLFTCKNDPSHTRTEVIAKLYDCDGGDNCPSKQYTDVDRSAESWSHEPIDWAVLKEITNGTSKTTFSPDNTCTRAQAVTFLWRAAGCPEPADSDSPFTDVTLDSWYAKAVLWAVEKNITNGTSATTFSPDDTCTRGQIVTFLWRMQGKPTAKAASSFEDVPAGEYFAKAVDWAVEQGITNGVTATQFAPNGDCTRAHIVTFLFRQFGK